jgi:hypothetical protein
VTSPYHVYIKPLELAWGNLEMQPKESLEYCKLSLTGDSGRGSEDQNANRNADSED